VKTWLALSILGFAQPVLAGPLYRDWASWNGLSGVAADPNADPDGDGIPNSVEFVVGSTPNPFMLNFSPARLLPTSTVDSNYLILVYRRSNASTEFPSAIQFSTSLLSWQNAVNGVSGVVITVEAGGFGADDRGNPIDRVTVKLPRSLAVEGKLFARLSVISD
jgi:hypothetical protein